jgi:NAD(P)-dependent dehydrogenase (short-subunit alcohol dehydrogenase family)
MSRDGLEGRVAIVTGASDGLGKEFAHGLAEAGARVVVAARRAEVLEQVASELRDEHGVEAVAVPADVSDEASVTALVAAAVEAFGTVDILVNNAGTTFLSPLLEHTLADWQRVIDLNLTGTFLASREAARVMVPKRSGSIVNISSVFAMGATNEYPVIAYYASKGGVEGLTKGLAVELGPHDVRVNAIAPGFFPSPMSTDMFAESELGERLRRDVLLPRTALSSLPRSADLRGAVRFLAGDESAFVTGHTLAVDGGWRAF